MAKRPDLQRYDDDIAEAVKRVELYRRNMRDDPSIKVFQDGILKSLEDELAMLKRLRSHIETQCIE